MIGRFAAPLALIVVSGCATLSPASPQDDFFDRLTGLCGKAFAGQLISHDAADAAMAGKPMVMHVRRCTPDRIEIPFHIGGQADVPGGWDRSRTWVITRTATGLRLKHDHRHTDGTSDTLTMYGGDTADRGSATTQRFPVDAESIALFRRTGRDVSVTNVWAIEVDARRYTYALMRANRDFRVAFDLTRPVAPPPPPWGSTD